MRALRLLSFFLILTGTLGRPRRGCPRYRRRLGIVVKEGSLVDLTHAFDENAAYWPSHDEGFRLINFFTGFVTSPFKYFYSTNTLSTPEHAGTHMDAPSHFAETAHGVDEVSLYNLFAPGVLLNLVKDGERFDKDGRINVDHFLALEEKYGQIPQKSIVLVRTGYGEIYYERDLYLGTNLTGPAAVPELHFPGFHPDAARWLADNRSVVAIGLDTPGIDYGQSKDFLTHRILAERNIPAFENVANLQLLEEGNCKFHVIALPMKIKNGTGAATRIVAVLK